MLCPRKNLSKIPSKRTQSVIKLILSSGQGRSGYFLRRPSAAQLLRLYAVLRYLGCCRCILALKQIYRQIPNSGAHCNGIIHRACAGNDLTSRGFGNYFRDTTPNQVPLLISRQLIKDFHGDGRATGKRNPGQSLQGHRSFNRFLNAGQ